MRNAFFGTWEITGMSHVDEPKRLLHSRIKDHKCQQNHFFSVSIWKKLMDLKKKSRVELYMGQEGTSQGTTKVSVVTFTLPETNIAPENWWLEDNFPFWEGLFSGANC